MSSCADPPEIGVVVEVERVETPKQLAGRGLTRSVAVELPKGSPTIRALGALIAGGTAQE